MKVTLSILAFLFLSISTFGQSNAVFTKLIDTTKTWRTATSEQLDSFYFNLQPLESTGNKFHIRVSMTGQIIDLYNSDSNNYRGLLTNYITEYKTVKHKDQDYDQSDEYQYVIEQISLDQALVDKMVEKLIRTKQQEIATDTSITSWKRNFLHCNSLVFQFSINGKYSKQTFHCPWGQKDSVEFKAIVLDNYQNLKTIFQLDSLYNNFESKLSKGKTYSRDGYRMMYILTDQQSENWKKTQPQRDYLKSISKTVDSYILAELKKTRIELVNIRCFEDYHLTFGTDGKLTKVDISINQKPKLKDSLGLGDYLADQKEVRKCKRKIKQIFSHIDLGSLNLKYELYRTFSFDYNGEFQLSDNTIY